MPDTMAEKVYYRLPVFAQNALFSLKGLQLAKARYNGHFADYLAFLKESEWWPADEIRKFQDARVRELVRSAYEDVPFYKTWFDEHGVRPEAIETQEDLHKLPILTKAVVREHQNQMVSGKYRLKSLSALLTSGTTGTPLCIWRTAPSIAEQWAIWWRHKGRFGLTRRDWHLMFGARIAVSESQVRPPFWRHDVFGRRTYLSVYHLSPRHMPAIVEFLNNRDYDFYQGYPSAMFVLADFMVREGIHLLRRPKCIISGSDALLPAFAKRIKQAFGANVTEQYGMAEFAGNMSKCEYGRFHLDFECCCLQEEDVQGASGSKSLIFTGWGNPAMPFIRYQVGDYGRISSGPCPCGRESIGFDCIDGRTEDYVRTSDGRKIVGMNQVFEYAPGATAIQIYQDRLDEIEVRVIPGPEYGIADEQALLRELGRRVGTSLKVKIVKVAELERSRSGKLRAVVSKIRDGSEGEAELSRAVEG